MKTIWMLLSIIAILAITACGGGGGSAPPPPPPKEEGTAAQYFTKTAVGNTWEYFEKSIFYTATTYTENVSTYVKTITDSTSTVASFSETISGDGYYVSATGTMQIDATGSLVVSDKSSASQLFLPATFSVGTAWNMVNATDAWLEMKADVKAFNVTRVVPAGTFTDCVKIDINSRMSVFPWYDVYGSIFISPTAGGIVDSTYIVTQASDRIYTRSQELQRYTVN